MLSLGHIFFGTHTSSVVWETIEYSALASLTVGDQLGLRVVLAVGVFVGLLEVGDMTRRHISTYWPILLLPLCC